MATLFGADFDDSYQGWEAKQNDKGVIYFVNNSQEMTSWVHPYLKKILEELDTNYSPVKYAAYRTAMKMRDLQCKTGIQWISITAMKKVFADHAHAINDDQEASMSCSQTLGILESILQQSYLSHQHEAEIPRAADVILNLMMNLYDVNRTGKLCCRSVKNALMALCKIKLNLKYKSFFMYLRDEQQKIKRENLTNFIEDLMQITDLVNESSAFGTSIVAAVDSCFKFASVTESNAISREDFYSWLLHEPQTFVWLPTLHRIQATETVQHSVRCCVCENMPIIGFRYRCLQCFKYDMCQTCFLHGLTSHAHKLKHPMKEYCFPVSLIDNTKALFHIIMNRLSRRHRYQQKVNYLPVDESTNAEDNFDWQPKYFHNDPEACNSPSTDSGLAVDTSGPDSQSDRYFVEDETKPDLHSPSSDTHQTSSSSANTFLSKESIEAQQKEMAQRIEQLQNENRTLKMKLNTLLKYYDNLNLSEAEDDMEIPRSSPFSPILSIKEFPDEIRDGSENALYHINTLSIVGTSTPIGHPTIELGTSTLDNQNSSALEGNTVSEKVVQIQLPEDMSYKNSTFLATLCTVQVTERTQETDKMDGPTESGQSTESNCLLPPPQDGNMSLVIQEPIVNTDKITSSKHGDDILSSHIKLREGTTNERENTYDSDCATKSGQLLYQTCDMSLTLESTEKSADGTKSVTVEGNVSTDDVTKSSKERAGCISTSSATPTLTLGTRESNPCLIFRSSSLRTQEKTPETFHQMQVKQRKRGDTSESYLKPFDENTHIELSEIFANNVTMSPSFTHHHAMNSNEPSPNKKVHKRNKLEPVHMSTPVHISQSALPSSCGTHNSHLESNKENQPLVLSHGKLFRTAEEKSAKMTPLSSIPAWQRKRLLMSSKLRANNTVGNETCDTTGTLSSLFQKAEVIGKMMNGTSTEPEGKDELQDLIRKLEQECKSDTDSLSCGDLKISDPVNKCQDDCSMLKAVHTIGDAMTDLVQASTHYQS